MDYYTNRLRAARAYRGASGDELASILGITKQQYSKYENGVSDMPVQHFIKVCEYLNVDGNFLMGFSNQLKPLLEKEIKEVISKQEIAKIMEEVKK